MFKLSRTTDDNNNLFRVATSEGSITIEGTGDFVVKILKDLSNSEEYIKILRKNLEGYTREDIAEHMRIAGFPEQIVRDFENGDFWDDLVTKKSSDGR